MDNLKQRAIIALRWSEQYTKTDMVYLASGGFWAIWGQILVSLATFMVAIAFAHFISREAYGEYKYILSIASILSSFTLTGLGTSLIKSISDGYEGTLNESFWKNIRYSILFVLLALGTSIYYFVNDNSTLGIAMLIVGSLSPIIGSTGLYNSYLIAKKDFKRSAIYFNVVGNIFPSLCIFISMLLTKNPLWLIAVYFSANALVGIILYRQIIKIYQPNKKVDPGALSYGKHLSLIGILVVIANEIDQVLVFHYIGPVELAIYNFARAIPDQIKGPMKSLAGLIFPKFSEHSDKEIRLGMKNKLIILLVTAIVLILIYITLAPYIFEVFFPKYSSSVFYSQVLSLSFLGLVSIPAEIYLSAKKKIREQYANNIVMSIIQIATIFVFISVWGLLGIVIARVFIRLARSTVNILSYEKASRSDHNS